MTRPATGRRLFAALLLMPLLFAAGCAASMQLPEVPDDLPSTEPFRGTNVMYIETNNDDPDAVRDQMIQAMQLQDYEVDRTRSEANLLTTMPRTFGTGVAGSARYHAEILDDGRVKLTGEFVGSQTSDQAGFDQFESYRVAPQADRLSTSQVAWQAMESIAESYEGGTVLYGLENA